MINNIEQIEKTSSSLYTPEYINFKEEPLFCGSGKNTQRFDNPKYVFFDKSNDEQQGNDWVASEIPLIKDTREFKNVLTYPQQTIITKDLQRLIFLDSLQGRSPTLILGQITTLPELENVISTWTYFEGCVTPDTEVLTPSGWVTIDRITTDDKVFSCNADGFGEMNKPTKIHKYKSNGHITKFSNSNLSQQLSDEHRMLLVDRSGNRLVKKVNELNITKNNKTNYGIVNTLSGTINNSDKLNKLTNYDRFLIALQADGTIHREYINEDGNIVHKNRNGKYGYISVTFSFAKNIKQDRLRNILNTSELIDMGITFKEKSYKENHILFIIKIPNTELLTKNMDEWVDIEKISYTWANEFIHEVKHWDGWVTKNPTFGYNTTNKNNADTVEMVSVIGGFRVSKNIDRQISKINEGKNWNPLYKLTFKEGVDHLTRQSIKVEKEEYNGYVHCLTVPGDFFVIRHNGKVSITGNCKHSRTYTEILRALYAKPDEIFDESFDIPELQSVAKSISDPFEIAYFNVIEYIYKTQRGIDITEDDMNTLYDSLIMCIVEINILEGMRFYSGFAAIWGMTEAESVMKGVSDDLSLICRDENTHLALTQMLIKLIRTDESNGLVKRYKLLEEDIFNRYIEAFQEELDWVDFLFKDGSYIGMNSDISKEYLCFITIKRMRAIGLKVNKDTLPGYYVIKNPIPWVDKFINMDLVEKLPMTEKITNYITGGVLNEEDLNENNEILDLL